MALNLFEAVKDAVSVREAAKRYGIEANGNGMARCPFHEDKDPSLKLYEDHFHCFGCGEHGDVIDLVGKLFNLSPKQSAEKLAADFGIQLDYLSVQNPQKRPSVISKLEAAQEFRKKEDRCCQVLSEYYRLMSDWKERYAPQSMDEEWHPLFVEALHRMDQIEYLLDELACGSLEERAAIVMDMEKEVDGLAKRLAVISGKEPTGFIKSQGTRCSEEQELAI